jgi:hypothetical protein
MHPERVAAALALTGLAGAAGCDFEETSTRSQAIAAFCEATVETASGPVTVDVETDYLPHVVTCENGNAAPAALEAQAVAARSYLYYRLERTGSIGDGTGDQVYTCAREPGPEHHAAVEATQGLVLRYQDTQVAAFYVAGALQDPPGCTGGTNDPTATEMWVTYNEGLSGSDVNQTPLGFVDPANHANRGCMSQNGGDCLAEAGYDVRAILRFYYGEDIGIEQAEGPCVTPMPGGPDAGAGGDDDPGAATSGCAIGGGAGAGLGLVMGVLLVRGRRRRNLFRPRSGRCEDVARRSRAGRRRASRSD